jgi:LPXTG-motif cell wall-anchored protein
MKPSRGILFGAIAVLVITALSAAVASAQNGTQPIQSGNAAMPIDVASSSPTDINANYDTGNKINTYMAGQTNTNSSQQKLDPQRKQPRERPTRNNNNDAAPTEAAPTSGNSTNPSGSGPSNSTNPAGSGPSALKELPKSGGATVPPLGIVGVLLVAGGLLVRKALQ